MNKKFNISIFYILFFLAAVFLSGYVLLELRDDYLAVLGSIAVLLISAYLLIDKLREDILFYLSEIQKGNKDSKEIESENLAPYLLEIQKIEKAAYIAVKKNAMASEDRYKDLLLQMNRISDDIQKLMQSAEKGAENVSGRQLTQIQQQILDQDAENYQYQKNAFKAIIKYNKENAKQIAESANSNTKNIIKQNESETDRILEELHQLSEQIIQLSMIQERINDRIDEIQKKGNQTIIKEPVKAVPLPEVELVSASKEKPVTKPRTIKETEVKEEPKQVKEQKTITEPASVKEQKVVTEPAPVKEKSPVIETKPEEKKEPEPSTTIPDTNAADYDPNKQLSADEIAAMFASAGTASPAEEKKAEPEEEKKPEPSTAIPDTNAADYDPNKQLSADEIAAMFAASSK